MKPFTPIRNGLWTAKHRKALGEAVFLFGLYLSYMGANKDKIDAEKKEIGVLIYPKTIMKILDYSKDEWHSWHQLLVNSGYIESHPVGGLDACYVKIKKAFLDILNNNIK